MNSKIVKSPLSFFAIISKISLFGHFLLLPGGEGLVTPRSFLPRLIVRFLRTRFWRLRTRLCASRRLRRLAAARLTRLMARYTERGDRFALARIRPRLNSPCRIRPARIRPQTSTKTRPGRDASWPRRVLGTLNWGA